MRWFPNTLLCLFAVSAWGGTWIGEVVKNEAGSITVCPLQSAERLPLSMRIPLSVETAWREGDWIRFEPRRYGAEWWLEASWPMTIETVKAFSDANGACLSPDQVSLLSLRADGVLGIDAAGRLVSLRDPAFLHGFFIVPYAPEESSNRGLPRALVEAACLRKHLQVTEHRDLPWVFWSLQPARDSVARCRHWELVLFGETAVGLRWISPFEEDVSDWRAVLGVPFYRVSGQMPLSTPQLILIDTKGGIAFRYEGENWPLIRLERALDAALFPSRNP